MPNVRTPSFLNDGEVDEIIEYTLNVIESSKDPLEADVVDICAASAYNNRNADDFFQIVVNVFAYGAEQADSKRADPFARGTFEKLVEAGVDMAFAVTILDDRALSRDCSRDEIADFEALKDDYDVILRSIGGGRSSRGSRDRGSRGGRDRDRGRDNDRGGRSGRDRPSGRSGGSSRRRRNADGANNQTTAYRTRNRDEEEEIVEEAAPRAGRRTTRQASTNVIDLAEIKRRGMLEPNNETNTGHVYNPSHTLIGAIETDGRFVEVLQKVEDYEKHELRRSLLTHDNERRVVPLVSFAKTSNDVISENQDEVEIFVEPDVVRIEYPLINFDPSMVLAATYPVLKDHMSKIVLMQTILQAKFTMPVELGNMITNFVEFNTFSGWQKMLVALRDYAIDKDTHETTSLHVLTEVNRMDAMVVSLFNNYMVILGYPKVKMGCFINDWPAAYKWLSEREQADLWDDFCEYETKLFDANLKITLPKLHLVETGAEADTEEPVEIEPEIPTFFIERSVIMVQYAGSIVGDEVDFSRIGEPCTITYEETPDFFTSCNRLAKRRTGRFALADIYMTDSMGRLIVVGIRENNSGAIRATMYR